jgi:hypothetical protein
LKLAIGRAPDTVVVRGLPLFQPAAGSALLDENNPGFTNSAVLMCELNNRTSIILGIDLVNS